MNIKFIGTGSGKTSLIRFHTSLLIQTGGSKVLLVDAGDGVSKALLNQDADISSIGYILISHLHADHFSGLASLVTQMKLSGRTTPLSIHVHNNLTGTIRNYLNSAYLFPEVLDFELTLNGFSFDKDLNLPGSIRIMPLQNTHVKPKEGVKEIDENKFISSSFLIQHDDKTLGYTSDIGSESDFSEFEGREINALITESTHIPLDSITEKFKSISPAELYITHIDPEDEDKILNWHAALPDGMREKIIVSYDGLEFHI